MTRLALSTHRTTLVESNIDSARNQRWRRRWRRRVGFLLFAVAILAHPWWFAAVAAPLQYRDPSPLTTPVDVIVVLNGDGGVDLAARWLANGQAMRVLLFEEPPDRLVRYGVLPPRHEQDRQALLRRGAPDSSIHVLLCRQADIHWDREQRLNHWLQEHPQSSARVLCAELSSNLVGWRLNASPRQVRIVPLADRRFAAHQWWRSRAGAVAFLYGWFDLLYFALRGAEPTKQLEWDEKAYEAELVARFASPLATGAEP